MKSVLRERVHARMRKRAPMKLVKSGITMDSIATDTVILGELSLTEKGNRYIS